jgi:hypothetical protein
MLEALPLLVLNELQNEPHNAFVKNFASRYLARKAALETLKGVGLQTLPPTVQTVLSFLWRQWTMNTDGMELEITTEQLVELSQQWQALMLAQIPPEERLAGLDPGEVLSYFKPEEVLPYFKPEERLAGLGAEERLAGLGAEERLAGLHPEDILPRLSVEEIEAYLSKLKRGEQAR